MAQNNGNSAFVFLAHYEGDRTIKRSRELVKLRARNYEVTPPAEIGGRLGWLVKSVIADLCSFIAWRPASNNMCRNYGHVFDRRGSVLQNKCTECGATIHSADELRSSRWSAKATADRDPRSVIRW